MVDYFETTTQTLRSNHQKTINELKEAFGEVYENMKAMNTLLNEQNRSLVGKCANLETTIANITDPNTKETKKKKRPSKFEKPGNQNAILKNNKVEDLYKNQSGNKNVDLNEVVVDVVFEPEKREGVETIFRVEANPSHLSSQRSRVLRKTTSTRLSLKKESSSTNVPK